MQIKLVEHTEDPELTVAKRAAISHDATFEELENARSFIRNLIEWKHFSPFEFSEAQFKITGVSRSLLAQLSRHRLASMMVRSQRYCSESGNEPVIPEEVEKLAEENEKVRDELDKMLEHYHWFYDYLRDNGIKKENARYFLPIGSSTELFFKANFREWRHIIELRANNNDAQKEIRKMTSKILGHLYNIAPSCFEDLVRHNLILEGAMQDEA